MNRIQFLNRLMLLVVAPFLGIITGIIIFIHMTELDQPEITVTELDKPEVEDAFPAAVAAIKQGAELATRARSNIETKYEHYNQATNIITNLVPVAKNLAQRPYQLYDQRISNKLGKANATINTNRLKAQLYYKRYEHFQGYLVKIHIKSSAAVDMVLGGDELGDAMTTVEAAKQYGAAVAVNAGGFADSGSKRYPIGTTIIDGKYVNGFHPSENDLFFAGFNKENELIGGKFYEKAKLDQLEPRFGATFVPILIKDGKNQTIPDKWKKSPVRAPRVVLANFKHEQIVLFVTDGYYTNNSKGATLEEIQNILQEYDIENAYNMDGGGSATLVFNGQLINSPSDSKLRKLPTHLLFYR